jgi:hypothetical protein
LVVANDDIREGDVGGLIDRDEPVETLVVAPMLNAFMGHPVISAETAERDAEVRLVQAILSLSAAGIPTSGVVGDADPMVAVEDAMSVFDADEVVIAIDHGRSAGWLGEKLAERVRARVSVPVRHLVLGHTVGRYDEDVYALPSGRR